MPFFANYKERLLTIKISKIIPNPVFSLKKKIQQSELFYSLRQRKGSLCSNQKLKGF